MRDNKGFSLVELIIVLAIMAVLVGVIAPMLIKYVEKTKVSADIQLCDTIHNAIVVVAADESVRNSDDVYSATYCGMFFNPSYGDNTLMASSTSYSQSIFAQKVAAIVGFNPFEVDGREYMKSSPAHTSGVLKFHINSDGGDFVIYIDNSDNTGDRQSYVYASDPDKVISNYVGR